jgi:hypothetical protein
VRLRRVLAALVFLGLVCVVTTTIFSALSSSTGSPGNLFSAGTVYLSDNDAGAALLSLSAAVPGATDTGCIRVTYGGSLDANVRLYATVSGALAPYLTLSVTRGTETAPSFDSCSTFTADPIDYRGVGPGVVYSGLLSAYPTGYATGLVDPPTGTVETWTTGESHSYRFTITLNDDNAAQGLSATSSFHWEARNL